MNAIRTREKIPSVTNLRGITKLLNNWLQFICLFVILVNEITKAYKNF